MIQRIQSLYLLLAIVCTAAMLSLGTLTGGKAATAWPWFTSAFYLLAAVFMLSAGVGIAQFGNRPVQLKTVSRASLLALLLAVLVGVGMMVNGDLVAGNTEALVAAVLPVAAFVFATLARFAIAKDIALVKSMDRLR